MVINPLDDVMAHFGFAFFAYIVLFIIISLNFCKALYIRKNTPKGTPINKPIQILDLFVSILCGGAMADGLMFQGVLADNNALGLTTWSNTLLTLSILSLIIFVLNLIVVFKKRN